MRFILLAMVLVMAGCGTSPTSISDAKLVPVDRVLNKNILNKDSTKNVEIIVSRDSGGFVGQGNYYRVYIDGRPVADLARGEYFIAYLSQGRHILSVKSVGFFNDVMKEIEVNAFDGDKLKFRLGADHSGDYFIYPTAF
ncbi:hypothetical protein ACNPDE_002149 [Vibrio fluvialis]